MFEVESDSLAQVPITIKKGSYKAISIGSCLLKIHVTLSGLTANNYTVLPDRLAS